MQRWKRTLLGMAEDAAGPFALHAEAEAEIARGTRMRMTLLGHIGGLKRRALAAESSAATVRRDLLAVQQTEKRLRENMRRQRTDYDRLSSAVRERRATVDAEIAREKQSLRRQYDEAFAQQIAQTERAMREAENLRITVRQRDERLEALERQIRAASACPWCGQQGQHQHAVNGSPR